MFLHDETLLEHCANGILHLEQIIRKTQARHTFVHLGYADYVRQREALASRQDQLSVKEHQEYAAQMERYRRLYQSVDHALNSVSRQQPHAAKMLKRKMRSVKALGERLEDKPLTHKFEGEEQIELFFDPEVRIANSRKQILDFHQPQLWAGTHLWRKRDQSSDRRTAESCDYRIEWLRENDAAAADLGTAEGPDRSARRLHAAEL